MLQLPAVLTQDTASACLRELAMAVRQQPTAVVHVNAAGLQRFDSSALAVLLELRRAALAQGKSLALGGLPQRLADLARLYGIAELLPAQSVAP